MSDRWARQDVEPAALAEIRYVNKNVSLQTGEEFSMEFLRDHTSVQAPIISGNTRINGHQFGDLYYQNQPLGYDSDPRVHELRRIELECPSDAYDFGRDPRTPVRVENAAYLPHFNAYNNVGGENKVITRTAFGVINSSEGRSTPSNKYAQGGDFDRFGKVKFLCSFGGRIMPRSTDEKLKYVGGETHIISIRKNLSWEELKKKTSLICQQLHSIKYQLPGDELDSLISVSSDEDLQNMMEEYNGLERFEGSQRPRLFLIPVGEPENNVQQRTLDSQYGATINCNTDPHARKIISGDISYHVAHLDRNPSFSKRSPGHMLRLDTSAMHPNPLFSGVQYNMPSYPSPPISPSPFHRDTNGAYSHFYGNNSSSESNNSFCPAQPNSSSFETSDYKYHNQRPLPSVNSQSHKKEAENPSGIQFHGGLKNENGRVIYGDKVSIPEDSKISFSGSTNSNDSYMGIPHSYSDSTLELNGGHSSYFSQERQSPSSPLHFLKKQTQEKPVHNDLADRRTQSNILDLKSAEGGEPTFQISHSPRRSENPTLHTYDEIYLNHETRKKEGNNDDTECNMLQNNNRGGSSPNLISLEESTVANVPNHAWSTEVSGTLSNKKVGSSEDFLFQISSGSTDRQIVHEAGRLEIDPTQKNRTPRGDGASHVRIPSIDINQPPPITSNNESVERRDTLETSPNTKTNNNDIVYLSEEAQVNIGEKESSLDDTSIVEMEASVYGLQIIKNADLEDLTELGSGTYGTVYHGKWRGTDVAIKRIRKSCFAGRSSEQERLTKDFWREAQILSNLHHPNVVAFYGIVPDGTGGTLATVTEFMVNGSLRHALLRKNRLLDARKKIIIAMDAAFGMEYLHSKNIVHFDLKCDNLLVNLRDPQRPICKVGDLGLSRIKRNTLVSGGVKGTLPWMAPELLNGSSTRVSEKVDVFSYGISMWEILTGEEPYADMHCGAIIGGIVKNTLRPNIPKTCPPEWKKLMEECWSIDPDSRPAFSEITSRLRTMSIELATKSRKKENKP